MSVVRGGGGIVVEAALEGPKKAAAHVVGAAPGSRSGIDASPAAPARPASVAHRSARPPPPRTTAGKHRVG